MNCNLRPQLADGVQLIENRSLYGNLFYVLACEERDKYMKVPPNRVQYVEMAIKLFDGRMTLAEIMELYPNIRFDQLYVRLKSAGFIEGYDIPSSEIDIMTKEMVSVNLQNITTNYRNVFAVYATAMKIGYMILFVLCVIVMAFTGIDIQELKTDFATYRDSAVGGMVILVVGSSVFMFLHELSHVAVAIKYGKYVEKISLNLYFGVLPMFYVKCKGLNTLQTKYKLYVVMAGVITNFMAALVSLTLLSMDIWESNTESMFKLFFWGNIFSGFTNLIPTSLSDGYFVLSTLLGKYDMKMFIFKDLFTKNRKLHAKDFMCYFLYMFFYGVSIGIILYSSILWIKDLLEGTVDYVHNIAIGIAVLYLFFVFVNIMHKIFKMRSNCEYSDVL